jgi:hypothetical protein
MGCQSSKEGRGSAVSVAPHDMVPHHTHSHGQIHPAQDVRPAERSMMAKPRSSATATAPSHGKPLGCERHTFPQHY